MTADELQRIVVRLADQSWVRYWLHWNFPRQGPWLMAIQLKDTVAGVPGNDRMRNKLVADLLGLGFTYKSDAFNPGLGLHVIERTNEDGTPFTSSL